MFKYNKKFWESLSLFLVLRCVFCRKIDDCSAKSFLFCRAYLFELVVKFMRIPSWYIDYRNSPKEISTFLKNIAEIPRNLPHPIPTQTQPKLNSSSIQTSLSSISQQSCSFQTVSIGIRYKIINFLLVKL
jgi:hypothetical protein